MTILKDTANQFQYGVAGPGANPENTCDLNNMQVKTRYPFKHGEGVKDEHLGFSNLVVPVGQQHVLAPVFDEGSTIAALQTAAQPGTNLSLVCGTVPQIGNMEGATPGNNPFSFLQMKKKNGAGTKTPPNSEREGEIFKIVEKGIEHSLSLLDGTSSHGAFNIMAGLKNEALKTVATAKEQFEKVLDSSMLSQMPGMNFNLGDMLNQLSGDQAAELFKDMPKEIQTGLKNTLAMMQNASAADAGGFMTGGRVNPEVFTQNIVSELKDVKTIGQMMNKLQTLQGDESLRGMDQYANVAIEIETAFGNVTQQLTSSGGVSLDIPEQVQNILSSFQSQLSNLPGAGGPSKGMFQGSQIGEIFNRLPKEAQEKFKELTQKHVDSGSGPRSLLNGAAAKVIRKKLFPMFDI